MKFALGAHSALQATRPALGAQIQARRRSQARRWSVNRRRSVARSRGSSRLP